MLQDSAKMLKKLVDQKGTEFKSKNTDRKQTLKEALDHFHEKLPKKFDQKNIFSHRIESADNSKAPMDEITNDIIREVVTILAVSGG